MQTAVCLLLHANRVDTLSKLQHTSVFGMPQNRLKALYDTTIIVRYALFITSLTQRQHLCAVFVKCWALEHFESHKLLLDCPLAQRKTVLLCSAMWFYSLLSKSKASSHGDLVSVGTWCSRMWRNRSSAWQAWRETVHLVWRREICWRRYGLENPMWPVTAQNWDICSKKHIEHWPLQIQICDMI